MSIKDIMGYLLMPLKEDKSYEKYTYNARYLEHIASEISLKKNCEKNIGLLSYCDQVSMETAICP